MRSEARMGATSVVTSAGARDRDRERETERRWSAFVELGSEEAYAIGPRSVSARDRHCEKDKAVVAFSPMKSTTMMGLQVSGFS